MNSSTSPLREYYNYGSSRNVVDSLGLRGVLGPHWSSELSALYADKDVHVTGATNQLEEVWLSYVGYFGDFQGVVVFYLIMTLCYVFAGILWGLVDYLKLLKQYKIQPDKYVDVSGVWLCITNIAQNYILVIVPLLFVGYPIFKWLGFSALLPLPSWSTFCAHFFFFMLAEDFSHYFFHRLLHTPWLYKNIHKMHHTYQTPFGLAASFAHPLEILILGFCTFCGPLILAPHYFTFFMWQLEAVFTHSGYEIPNPFEKLPFYGGAKAHDFHHKVFNCNYSSRFTYLDLLFSTYKEPK